MFALLEDILDVGPALGALGARAGDFLQGQEAVLLRAEVDEGGLKAGLHADHAGLVDVALLLLVGAVFDVEVVELLTVDEGDPDLFGLGRVDKHAFHVGVSVLRTARNATRSSAA